jgi:hypothetical protein
VGTIDGNAINKLNLVVNLTRHIHVKAMVRDEEDSGLEFSECVGSTSCFVDHVLPLWLRVRAVLIAVLRALTPLLRALCQRPLRQVFPELPVDRPGLFCEARAGWPQDLLPGLS